MGFAFGKFGKARQLEHLFNARGDICLGHIPSFQPKGDILPDRQMWEQGIGLEHHVHRPLVRRDARDILTRQFDLARAWVFKPGKHAHHRCFTAARGPQQCKELAFINTQRQIIDRNEIAKTLCHILEADKRLFVRVIPRGENGLAHFDLSFAQRLPLRVEGSG